MSNKKLIEIKNSTTRMPTVFDLVLINLHYKNQTEILKIIKNKILPRTGLLTQIYVMCHKPHKNPMFSYNAINNILKIFEENNSNIIIKDQIFIVKTKPQYLTNSTNEVNLHGHHLFSLVNGKNKYLWRQRQYNLPMKFLLPEDPYGDINCCGDVWVVKNHKQTDFPSDLFNGIVEFSNVPEDSIIAKVGF